jgi:hypothetical protein
MYTPYDSCLKPTSDSFQCLLNTQTITNQQGSNEHDYLHVISPEQPTIHNGTYVYYPMGYRFFMGYIIYILIISFSLYISPLLHHFSWLNHVKSLLNTIFYHFRHVVAHKDKIEWAEGKRSTSIQWEISRILKNGENLYHISGHSLWGHSLKNRPEK